VWSRRGHALQRRIELNGRCLDNRCLRRPSSNPLLQRFVQLVDVLIVGRRRLHGLHQGGQATGRQLIVNIPQQFQHVPRGHILTRQSGEDELVEERGAEVLGGELLAHGDQQSNLQGNSRDFSKNLLLKSCKNCLPASAGRLQSS